jgi:ABC-2 type transport system ATP-binding protein
MDDLVDRLVDAGVAVRELAPVVAPLESAFLALTGAADASSAAGAASPADASTGAEELR